MRRTRAYRRRQAERATERARRNLRAMGDTRDALVNTYATDRCPHKAPRRMGKTRATVRAAITLSEQLNEL
jgi:hypothetical protein